MPCSQFHLSSKMRNGCAKAINNVRLHYEKFGDIAKDGQKGVQLKKIVIAHGMLGSASNWSSMAKSLYRKTGRNIITFDARNHGKSQHTEAMGYKDMANDMVNLIENENADSKQKENSVVLVGHSMGGRTCMFTALE